MAIRADERLELEDLRIMAGSRVLVDGASLEMLPGEIIALVGASGSGKTLTARSILGLGGPRPGMVGGRLSIKTSAALHEPYAGIEEANRSGRMETFRRQVERRFRAVRGDIVGYLPQDARGSLDPLRSVRWQIEESMSLSRISHASHTTGKSASDWLFKAGFSDPIPVLGLYPHQLSGGMAQRVSIALALARGSRYLIADEPTTGLDPSVQNEILIELRRTVETGVSILLITHDLRLVARLASRVLIMHEGRIVERLASDQLDRVSSPQGRSLLQATARVGGGLLP